MKITKKKLSFGLLIALGFYAGSFAAIKIAKPSALTSNDGPGRIYCTTFLPLRFLAASSERGYWGSFFQNHWQTVRYVGFNPGNGYLEVDYLDGTQGRAWAGRDIGEAKEGEIWQVHFEYALDTWDDFSDHLIAGVDRARRPNRALQPTLETKHG